ncbi:src-like-adapter 2 [Brienomyrus brachyistius]|uniref:src-like-adapter 2 n=1 Tax=Brienomyrus brachyistius TaxID=42636 RepID=UPI0020B319E3|nr:src-like-adapter 2 [Brienomyrus brachyistius]XP_048839201.1 src-like-adapter 2 [Brienomyrus brachyistius]
MGSHPSKVRRRSNVGSSLLNQEGAMEPVILENNRYVVISLYNYPTEGQSDCSIRVGERLNVLSNEGDWWKVSSSATGRESYIPCSYIAKVFHRWHFEGISREKAEELLLQPYNQIGSFMIRDSQTHSGAYSLSIRRSAASIRGAVKHYRINQLPNGWFHISPSLTFSSLSHLVDHYSEVADGLCCMLREPCFIQGSNNVPVMTGPQPMTVRKPTINWKDVDSSMIFSKDAETKEESPVSEGLREAITSYLYMTEGFNCEDCISDWKT